MENILVFEVGALRLGVDSDRVDQVLRVPLMTPVPYTRPQLKGVAMIDGKLCQVLDSHALWQQPQDAAGGGQARLVTFYVGQDLLGLLVDSVAETLPVDEGEVILGGSDETEQPSGVTGLFHHGDAVIQLLNLDQLAQVGMVTDLQPMHLPIPLSTGGTEAGVTGMCADNEGAGTFYLIFRLGDNWFGLDTLQIREILFAPEALTPLACAEEGVLGVQELREELITILDLSAVLTLGHWQATEQARVLLLTVDEQVLGVAVDQVLEAREFAASEIDPVVNESMAHRLSGLVRHPDGQIVSLLSPHYVRDLVRQYATTRDQTQNVSHVTQGREAMEQVELAVFNLGNETYAFDIEQVQEIIRYQPVQPVPEPPPFVEGIINLRGKVIPVVNLATRLGFEFRPTENSKMVVGLVEGEQVAFMVDEVEDVLSIDLEQVTFSEDNDNVVHATVVLDEGKKVILWLRTERIFKPEYLKQFSDQRPKAASA